MPIKVLPEEVISQIAAGEVIERPAYVVKELIDNAIDANATTIKIEAFGGGTERIIVTDDGGGILPDELSIALKLHATSKLSQIEDLARLKTLGFRGEALASISAIGELILASRHTTQPIGAQITNRTMMTQSVGMAVGTRVTVEHLFSNVPARKKFIKSMLTEKRALIDIVTSYALAYPSIRFTMFHDKKLLFDLPIQSLQERYAMLIGENAAEALLPIKSLDSYLEITGYIAKPSSNSPSTRGQFLYINQRPVSDRLISTALKEAYSTLLPKDQYPNAVLFFAIPTQLVDVNVHPRKEHVSFAIPNEIFLGIKTALSEVLEKNNLTFPQTLFTTNINSSIAGKILKDAIIPTTSSEQQFSFETLQQWHTTYISIQTDRGVLFFDQHAVHERILFEKFERQYSLERGKKDVIPLDKPVTLEISPADATLFDEYRERFEELGFTGTLKKRCLLVTHVPALLADRDIVFLIKEWMADLQSDLSVHSTDSHTYRMITSLACRSAVKAGDHLSKDRMRELITELFQTKNRYTCPHGRPTMIETKKEDLDKMFRRL